MIQHHLRNRYATLIVGPDSFQYEDGLFTAVLADGSKHEIPFDKLDCDDKIHVRRNLIAGIGEILKSYKLVRIIK